MDSMMGRGWKLAVAAVSSLLAIGSAPANAALIVDIQPVSICLDDGSNCAAIGFNAATLQNFWLAEAGISLNILATRNFNSTALRTMNDLTEVQTFLLTNPSPDPAGPTGFVTGPINIWFADSAFSPPGSVELTVQGGNRSWIASNLAAVDQTLWLAHGLGHALGLEHFASPTNLMNTTFSIGTDLSTLSLNAPQEALVQSSRFVREGDLVAVPAPAALGLFLLGLGMMARRRKG